MRDPQRHPTRPSWRTLGLAVALIAVVVTTAALVAAASATTSSKSATIKVGLITKDATNRVLRQDARRSETGGDEAGRKAQLCRPGRAAPTNASQIAAIENMTTAGVKGILITVADGKAENAAIAKARKRGVIVIALDTPTVPPSATNALYATNNFNAGVLIGKYARAATKGKKVTIAMIDEARRFVGGSVAAQRLPEGVRDQERQLPDRLCLERRGSGGPVADGHGETACRRTRTSTSSTRSTSPVPRAPGRR